MSVWAVVPAGGSGTRFGGHKQFADLGGRTLLERCLDALLPIVDGVVVALPARSDHPVPETVRRVTGGSTRLDSVRAALAVVPDDAEIIVVHGPSHPLASAELTTLVIAAVRAGADGAVPGLPVVDALKRIDADGTVVATVVKAGVVTAQTPQAFAAGVLRAVHAARPERAEDSELVEQAGGRIVVVPGVVTNLHVATPADLDLAHAIVARSCDRTIQ